MTFIPNARSRVNKIYNKESENVYYEGYLNDEDATYVAGFDWVADMVLENYFSDEQVIDTVVEKLLNEELADKIDGLSDENKQDITDAIKEAVLSYLECERDELIVSMIDNMEDSELEKAKKDFEEGRRNDVLRQLKNGNHIDDNGNYIDETT